MIDPTSFLLRDLARSGDGKAICGEVNGKNRMGGYTGFAPFVAVVEDGKAGTAAVGLSGGDDPGSGNDRNYRDLYEAHCEPAASKAKRAADERAAEEQQKIYAADLLKREQEEQAKREAATKAEREAKQLFVNLQGSWGLTSKDCGEYSYPIQIYDSSIKFGDVVLSIRNVSSAGRNAVSLNGRMITAGSMGEVSDTVLRVTSARPQTIDIYKRSYERC